MDEGEVLDLGGGGFDQTRRGFLEPVCLVGKLISGKSVNSYALTEVMIKAFRAKGKLNARDWGNGMLIFSFELGEDREWVIRNQPWHFDNALFAIKPLSGREQPLGISLTLASFWIRVYDLPLLTARETRSGGVSSLRHNDQQEINDTDLLAPPPHALLSQNDQITTLIPTHHPHASEIPGERHMQEPTIPTDRIFQNLHNYLADINTLSDTLLSTCSLNNTLPLARNPEPNFLN
ncbi:hypothetical protein ACS0TY_005684 [Phlomoides rotata]